jgi:Fungal chitosanase of glycosyl hydrolase group 75
MRIARKAQKGAPRAGLTRVEQQGKVPAMGVALRFTRACPVAIAALALAAGCGPARVSVGDDRTPVTGTDSGSGLDLTAIRTGLLAVISRSNCSNQIATGLAPRPASSTNVDICGLSNAVYWQSGLEVLCDGVMTTTCNINTDPQYQSTTLAKDSSGNSLDAAAVPYIEMSAPTSRFDYTTVGLQMGSVAAVIRQTQITFAVVGTEGIADVIGDASYATAKELGMNPDPVEGGEPSGITYFAFTGPSNVLTKNEDHAEAVRLGQAAAAALIRAGM